MVWPTIPSFSDSYGHTGIWCWIARETGLRFGLWYISLFVLSFLMFSIYVYLLRVIIKFQKSLNNRSVDERAAQKQMCKDLKSLLAYPFIYILFSIPIFIYRIFEETHPHVNPVMVYKFPALC